MENGEKGKTDQMNNQGLTLLELLIAVIILAIIVIPFLNSFVISAKTNSRAAKTHRATTVAQNIVEGFKAGSLADVMWQMNYPEIDFHVVSPDSVEGALGGNVYEMMKTADGEYVKSISSEEIRNLHPDMKEKELRKEFLACDGADGNSRRNSIFSMDEGATYEFIPQYKGKYYFAIENVTVQGSTFDALIFLDSSKYREGGTVTADKQYNGKETVQIIDMEDTKDAIFVQTKDMDETAISELKWKHAELTDQFKTENMKRKITVSIENSGGEKAIQKVKVNYLYTFTPDPTITYGANKDYWIFNNSETGEELRSIYLYFMPWYNPSKPDEIEIDNGVDSSVTHAVTGSGSLPVELYIVKQETGDPGTLNERENNYQSELRIYDDQTGGGQAVHKSLRTNLEQNLYQVYVPEGSMLVKPAVTYWINGQSIHDESEKEAKLNWKKDMSGSDVQDRIYEMTVSVYEEGAAENNFPEEDRLAQIVAERND